SEPNAMSTETHDAHIETHLLESPRIDVVRVASPGERLAALEIRRRVFAEEQGVADLRVADPDDDRSVIALATFNQTWADRIEARPVSTGRLTLPSQKGGQALIAWVATLPEARSRGVGGQVMRFLLDAADRAGAREVALAAQLPAENFYRRLGFSPAGPVYDVRGIPHRRMIRRGPN
ncbi:MAG TPA: GNAT family N-acetyltransferase, partial [Thermomicrobiales bacterium]|nr:GNAT family N-acetyltransferase [Thermomicrobiales bacterium]